MATSSAAIRDGISSFDASDDESAPCGSLPNDAGSKATHLPGDFDVHADGGRNEIYLQPVLTDNNLTEFTDGEWKVSTHGDGDKQADQGHVRSRVSCANSNIHHLMCF